MTPRRASLTPSQLDMLVNRGRPQGLAIGLSVDTVEANMRPVDVPLGTSFSTSSVETLVEIPFDDKGFFAASSSQQSFYDKESNYDYVKPIAWEEKRRPIVSANLVQTSQRVLFGLVIISVLAYLFHPDKFRSMVPQEKPGPITCNPFEEPGIMHVNDSTAEANFWRPHDAQCATSNLLSELRWSNPSRHHGPPQSLHWLQGRTAVLIGDSVDRTHLRQFCDLVEGKLEHIHAGNPHSPPPFRNGRDEHLKTSGDHNQELARPYVCLVERFDFMILSIFNYGLVTPEEYGSEWFQRDTHYYPPFNIEDRVEYIVKPILQSYSRNRPDLVGFASSFWDAALINIEQQRIPQAERISTVLPQYLARFALRLTETILSLTRSDYFKDATILWRSAHLPFQYDYVPTDIVFTLDKTATATIQNLKAPASLRKKFWWDSERSGLTEAERLNLADRIRIDWSGNMIIGHTQYLPDRLHPSVFPNGKIWGDILLYELERSIAMRT